MNLKTIFPIIFFSIFLLHAQAVETLISSSGKNQVSLVELFTSQSCSSCPPAEDWVSSLQQDPELWKKFVPIVFHVDYWNHLSWKDKFSSPKITKRQVDISKHWKNASVYTPAVVINGENWKQWHSQKKIPTSQENISLQVSITKISEQTFRIKVIGLKESKHYIINAVRLGMGISSSIKSGENAGKVLQQNFVVLDWAAESVNAKTNVKEFTFQIKHSDSSRLAIAAWIEEAGNPTPLQSTGRVGQKNFALGLS